MTSEQARLRQNIQTSYETLRGNLLGYLNSRVNDRQIAEDILHDVFAKALLAVDKGTAPQKPINWLQTIARNAVIDYYRSKRSMDELPDEIAQEDEYDPEAASHLAKCLRPFASELPSLYRDTLLATDFDGKTMREVAEAEAVSLSAIKSRASRGRKMLKQKLLDCCYIEVGHKAGIVDYQDKNCC